MLYTIAVILVVLWLLGFAVHIGGGDFMAIHPYFGKQPIETIEANLIPSATAALDELVWWARATMAARAATA